MAQYERRPFTFDRVMRIFFSIAAILGAFWLLDLLKGALLPFLVAWLLAYLLHPLVEFFRTKVRIRNRMGAIACALFSVVLFFGVIGYFILPSVIAEFEKLGVIIGNFLQGNRADLLPAVIDQYVREYFNFEEVATLLQDKEWMTFFEELFAKTWTFISGSVNHILNIIGWFIVLLYLIFILLDYDKIIESFKAMIPVTYRPTILSIVNDVEVSMNRYFRGQSLVAFLVGVLFAIGFLIVGLPLAIPLGLFIGLLNMVPYLQVVGLIPTLLLCLLHTYESGGNFWLIFFGAMAVFVVVQSIQDLFLVPRIMGKVTGLNPAIILLSLSIWGTLLGVVGMIIALPLTTLMLSYYQRYVLDRAEKKAESNTLQPTDSVEEKEEA